RAEQGGYGDKQRLCFDWHLLLQSQPWPTRLLGIASGEPVWRRGGGPRPPAFSLGNPNNLRDCGGALLALFALVQVEAPTTGVAGPCSAPQLKRRFPMEPRQQDQPKTAEPQQVARPKHFRLVRLEERIAPSAGGVHGQPYSNGCFTHNCHKFTSGL